MATEETRRRLDDLRISEESTKTLKGKGESTKTEAAGRKYCCAKCYHSCGRVTDVALERRVTLEPNAVVSGGKGLEHQLYYFSHSGIKNSHRVEVGMLNGSLYIRKFNIVCNFCDEIVGWHLTARNDDIPNGAYWCRTLMDREKVVLLDEEENEIARDCNVDSELPSVNYLKAIKAKKAKKVLPLGRARTFPWDKVFPQERSRQALRMGTTFNTSSLAQGTTFKPACERPWSYFA